MMHLLRAMLFAAAWASSLPALAAGLATCTGKFANPITDICWSCILPITLGSTTIANFGGQEDNGGNPGSPVCSCGARPVVGLAVGFFEPARMVEVARKPYCLPAMGGLNLDLGFPAPEHGRSSYRGQDGDAGSFYQSHWYANPVITWLEIMTGFPCLESGSFDLAYMTEVDPLWNDDELTLLIQPEAVLFANPVAIAACAADCVKATAGFGFDTLFWCSGCQGGIYPMDGNIPFHMGGVRTSSLLAHRMAAKMHRQAIAWGYHGSRGLCGGYIEPVITKSAYKAQLINPVPATDKLDGRCCQPFGRTTILWGIGKEYPVQGEDFTYMLFRKRNCCAGP